MFESGIGIQKDTKRPVDVDVEKVRANRIVAQTYLAARSRNTAMPDLPDFLITPVFSDGQSSAAFVCGDIRVVAGAHGAELSHSSGAFYQMAALAEKGRGWF